MNRASFLVILVSVIAGFILFIKPEDEKDNFVQKLRKAFTSDGIKLIVGLATMAMGIFKLIFSNDVPFVGDFLIAVTAMAAGFCLAFDYYKSKLTVTNSTIENLEKIFLQYPKFFGISVLASAFLHFLFFDVVIL